MVDGETEEEPYSLIFTSLKHPIRRRILRLLAEKPLKFSEIQKTLGIDTDHLSHHFKNLDDLIYTDKKECCHLSSFGRAAVNLMSDVEENEPALYHCRNKPRKLFAKTYPIALALVLLCASVCFVSYVTPIPGDSETSRWAFTLAESTIGVGENLELNFTLTELASENGKQTIDVTVGSSPTTHLKSRDKTLAAWYEDSMWIEMEPENCYSPRDMDSVQIELNGTAPDLTEFSGGFWVQIENDSSSNEFSYLIVDFSPELPHPTLKFTADLNSTIAAFQNSSAANFYIVYLPKLSVHIYTPDGNTINDYLQRSSEPYYTVTSFSPSDLYWISEASSTTSYRSSEIPLSHLGLYRLLITNNGPFRWDENFSLYIKSQRMEKPFFYLGIAGLIAALGYTILVVITNIRRSMLNQVNR